MILKEHQLSNFYYLAQIFQNAERKISRRLFSTSIGHRPMYLICRMLRSERALSGIASILSGRGGWMESLFAGRCPTLVLEGRWPSVRLFNFRPDYPINHIF